MGIYHTKKCPYCGCILYKGLAPAFHDNIKVGPPTVQCRGCEHYISTGHNYFWTLSRKEKNEYLFRKTYTFPILFLVGMLKIYVFIFLFAAFLEWTSSYISFIAIDNGFEMIIKPMFNLYAFIFVAFIFSVHYLIRLYQIITDK